MTDNPRGMRRAAEHLGGLGHERLTYAAGPDKKGVFTRDRRPKAAAHALRRRWLGARDGDPRAPKP